MRLMHILYTMIFQLEFTIRYLIKGKSLYNLGMFDFISKTFIKDYQKIDDPDVRMRYGILSSILSIVLNLILVIFKMIFGTITNSVAIIADGFNNLSDMGSNLASLFGFKLANKHPDSEHPYGHGRIEYIVGMIIAFLIIYVGITSCIDSLKMLFSDEKVTFSIGAIIVLVIAILIKAYMSYFNMQAGKKINSETLIAAGQDSKNDVISTLATLVSMCLVPFFDLPLDSIIGIFVSLFVIKSGFEIFRSTMDPLLGLAPDKELVNDIEAYIKKYPVCLGIHDLMIHDYGPGRRFMTLHVEVDAHSDIMATHDAIDLIERGVLKEFGILTTIHMDPIDTSDEKVKALKEVVKKIVKDINETYDIHDFRIVSGPTHTNLIFDVLLPSGDTKDHEIIRKEIEKRVKEYDPQLYCVMEIEHSYV